MRTIFTAGHLYLDIDALACAVAYQELLQKMGYKAYTVLRAPLNQTVSETVRQWEFSYPTTYNIPSENDRFVLVDFSDPHHFKTFIKENKS